MLKSYVSRIEELDRHISEFNDDKSDIFKEAKANGFDVKALRAVIAYRRKDPAQREEHESIVETYLHSLGHMRDNGTESATRARTTPPSPITPAPGLSPVQSATDAPLSGTEKLRQQLQASVAAADAGDIPAILDRRPQQ